MSSKSGVLSNESYPSKNNVFVSESSIKLGDLEAMMDKDILDTLCTSITQLDELQSSSRKVQIVDARATLIWLVLRSKLGSIKELASLLNRDPTSIARLEQRAEMSPKLRHLADEISSTLWPKEELAISLNHGASLN